MHNFHKIGIAISFGLIIGCSATNTSGKEIALTDAPLISGLPLYPNSVVSNDIDFIIASDPSTFESLSYQGQSTQEMPGGDDAQLVQDNVYVFLMRFSDGTSIEIYADPNFTSKENAQKDVEHFAGPLGKLPHFMRKKLSHVVLNIGDHTAFAEDLGHFIVVSTENMQVRRSEHDMEETLFHEAIHATLDSQHLNNPAWINAQKSDGNFITKYGADNPNKEDLAETALFYYTYKNHPERLTAEIRELMEKGIPARMEYLDGVFP